MQPPPLAPEPFFFVLIISIVTFLFIGDLARVALLVGFVFFPQIFRSFNSDLKFSTTKLLKASRFLFWLARHSSIFMLKHLCSHCKLYPSSTLAIIVRRFTHSPKMKSSRGELTTYNLSCTIMRAC